MDRDLPSVCACSSPSPFPFHPTLPSELTASFIDEQSALFHVIRDLKGGERKIAGLCNYIRTSHENLTSELVRRGPERAAGSDERLTRLVELLFAQCRAGSSCT